MKTTIVVLLALLSVSSFADTYSVCADSYFQSERISTIAFTNESDILNFTCNKDGGSFVEIGIQGQQGINDARHAISYETCKGYTGPAVKEVLERKAASLYKIEVNVENGKVELGGSIETNTRTARKCGFEKVIHIDL